MTYAYWSAKLLCLVLYIRSIKKAYYYKSVVFGSGSKKWWEDVQKCWQDIPNEIFHEAGIKKCNDTFELMWCEEVPEELMDMEQDELIQVPSPFIAYGRSGGVSILDDRTKRFVRVFAEAYEKLYGMLPSVPEGYAELVFRGEQMLTDDDVRPYLLALEQSRHDIITSDRECAALAIAFDIIEKEE